MEAYQLFLPTSALSPDTEKRCGVRRFYFSDTPAEPRAIMERVHFQHCTHDLPDNSQIRIYSPKNFAKVKELLAKIREEGNKIGELRTIADAFDNVERYILRRDPAYVPYPDDSEGDFDVVYLNDNQRMAVANDAAPYLRGQARIELYAALSGRREDVFTVGRITKRERAALRQRAGKMYEDADTIFEELMRVPTRGPEPESQPEKRKSFWDFLRRKSA
jgi:hypothetical protein